MDFQKINTVAIEMPSVLIKDQLPLLIDTGFGSDVKETERLIKNTDVSPEEADRHIRTVRAGFV